MNIKKIRLKIRVVYTDINGERQIGTVTNIDIKKNKITVQNARGTYTISPENAFKFDSEKTLKIIGKAI